MYFYSTAGKGDFQRGEHGDSAWQGRDRNATYLSAIDYMCYTRQTEADYISGIRYTWYTLSFLLTGEAFFYLPCKGVL